MKFAAVLRQGLGALALAVLALDAGAAGDVVSSARQIAAKKDWPSLVSFIEEHFKSNVPSGADLAVLYELFGVGLMNLGRNDEAAHYFDLAVNVSLDTEAAATRSGKADIAAEMKREAARLRKRVVGCDPLGGKRETLFKDLAKGMNEAAVKLADANPERALEILERIEATARGEQLAAISALADKIRSSTTRVNLDEQGGKNRPDEGWDELTIETKRYVIVANLEPDVAELLGHTMDEIFEFYVRVYFDGDAKKVTERKALLRVLPSREAMMRVWPGPRDKAPLAWWSPSEWQLVAYDTRTDFGTLDQMVDIMFHEASHHFMEMLSKGSHTPAWLNEGTASFFEGTIAMADGRVLWPDAARMRLTEFDALTRTAAASRAPSLADVIGYNEPGSYGGEYYCFGWGLVYFMQQYEDPKTFEYVYRPLYNRYRDEIIRKPGNPKRAFEEIFLGPDTPLKYATLEDFEKFWRSWILEEIYPQHFGDQRKMLRLLQIHRYLDAATPQAIDKKTKKPVADPNRKIKVDEQELLLRALGHIEYVRTRVDDPEEPDADILMMQSDVLERLGRSASAAPIMEQLLELADAHKWEATAAQVADLEKRLLKLDQKNGAWRIAKARNKAFIGRAKALLDEYVAANPLLLLRSYTFAVTVAKALDDDKSLGVVAKDLRTKAQSAQLLKGAIYKVVADKGAWKTIFQTQEDTFTCTDGRIEISSGPSIGRVCTTVPVTGEYEIRARLTRKGDKAKIGQQHGLVFSGTARGDWMSITLDKDGLLVLRRNIVGPKGGASDEPLKTIKLKSPPEMDKPFDIKIHVFANGELEVSVGAEGPFPLTAPLELPATGNVGVFVKNGELVVENLIVEIVP